MLRGRKYSLTFVQPRAASHGWIVVLGVSLVFIFNTSLATTFNIIFEPILLTSTATTTNLPTNIFTIISNLTILATGFLIKDLSAKHFVIIGSSILFFGIACSAFVVSIGQLIFTYSILCGIGLGLLNPAAFVAVFSCFSASRNHAIGVTFSALGLGQLVIPIIANIIVQNVNYQVGIGIMSVISLIGLLGANLLPSIKWRSCNEQCCILNCQNEEEQPLLNQAQCSSTKKNTVMEEVFKASDLDLFMDGNFLVISIGLAFIYAVSVDFTSILPGLLSMEMDIQSSIYIISISDILTRAFFSFIVSATEASSVHVFLVGVVGISITKILLLFINFHYFMLIFIFALFGIFRALTVVNQILIIDDFCRNFCPRKLPGMLGLSYVLKSIFLYIFKLIFQSLAATSVNASIHIYSHLILQCIVFIIWIIVL